MSAGSAGSARLLRGLRPFAPVGRYPGVLLVFLQLGAPMQCQHDPDPNNRMEDTAGDALWGLAQKFEGEHNDVAARDTLRYLVETYPANRHAPAARAKLGGAAAAPASDGG